MIVLAHSVGYRLAGCAARAGRAGMALVAGFVLAAAAWGQGPDECPTCADPAFPEAAQFLEAQGLPAGQYRVLLTWTEAAPADPARRVAGYRVAPAAGGEPFDLYSDARGRLLDAAGLAALGIRTKDWLLRPREAFADSPARAAAAEPAPPEPRALAQLPRIELPPVDLERALEEDAAGISSPAKGVLRIGVFQDLPAPVTVSGPAVGVGEWSAPGPDGIRVWGAAIRSPGAVGQRVHFPRLKLPAGAYIIIYNTMNPNERYGPYTGPPRGETYFWAPTCFADAVGVQCHVPAGADLAAVALEIDRVIHVYRKLDAVPWAASAGPCNLDATCYDAWAAAARGVGGIGTIGSPGYLWCTGSLLVDTNPATAIPYFLTAHHCVSGQSGTRGASSIEVYWLYQTPTCNGTPPWPTTVPRTTGGADYLAGSGGNASWGGGNDFTFLRLRQYPPSGLTYLGWSTVPHAPGTPIACIHHPSGDFKRIAFGAVTHNANPHDDLYHEVTYDAGTTEHGSSGCPLMLADTQQVIGQLWGGTASCYLPLDPDYYGRFDVTFPLIQQYLDPPGWPPEVNFVQEFFPVNEADALVMITLTLNAAPGGTTASVDYATSSETASPDSDYEPVSGTVTFEGTQQVRMFTVQVLSDTHTEPNESIAITLSNPVGCSLAPDYAPAQLTIADNDPDADGDGLSDYDEIHGVFGFVTDPDDPDTDHDGLSDYAEVMGANGLVTDPTQFTALSALSVPFFR